MAEILLKNIAQSELEQSVHFNYAYYPEAGTGCFSRLAPMTSRYLYFLSGHLTLPFSFEYFDFCNL